MTHILKCPKKLIEVALPLDAINEEAAREKSIRHGHPSTLHLWWARRPLAAVRAVIFAQLVNDPSWKWELEHPGEAPPNHLKGSWAASRNRLFSLITELVRWDNTGNEEVMERARAEIRKSWREVCDANKEHPEAATLFNPNEMPGLHDPFAGGGSIPLEAQRLGLSAYASDLNPVAVLINKAMIEIPPRFAGSAPVNPEARATSGMNTWKGAQGIAEDIRYYGAWIREEAWRRIGRLYPPIKVTNEMAADERPDLKPYVGKEVTVIAWIWARTVKSPNPAFSHVHVPLVSSFVLGTKDGKEAWVEPVVEDSQYRFVMRRGEPPTEAEYGTKASGRGADFRCIISGSAISAAYIRTEAKAGRMGQRLLAIVTEGLRGRLYLSPSAEHEQIAINAKSEWRPEVEFFQQALGFRVGNYGMSKWSDLFTERQLIALETFSNLVCEVREQVRRDAASGEMANGEDGLDVGGNGAKAYAEAIGVFLAFAVDRSADYWSSIATWHSGPKMEALRNTFGRPTMQMTWDFAEGSPFSDSSGNWTSNCEWSAKVTALLPASGRGEAFQADAQTQNISMGRFVCSDPPYFDNIGYADLSDFFYMWLRRTQRHIYPQLFASLSTPKAEELVATPARHGGKDGAESFFLAGMTAALTRLSKQAHPTAPVSIFYAFKQSETHADGGTSSTGWETFLEAIHRSGLAVTGTWPMRTELGNRPRGMDSNALASSIVLVCRKRPDDAPTGNRRQFARELNAVLPEALAEMTMGMGDNRSPVAPVDLSQAMIGPGMALFSKYKEVLEADGSPMSVRTALQLINRFLADDDFDNDTQFCLRWFEQNGWADGQFGEADVLARAKGTSVDGLKSAGVLDSQGSKVRLLRQSEYPADWNPATDTRMPIWEALHQLIRSFRQGGERAAGVILAAVKDKTEPIRLLAYRLYTLCERRGQAEEARGYNDIVTSWSAIEAVAGMVPKPAAQLKLFGET